MQQECITTETDWSDYVGLCLMFKNVGDSQENIKTGEQLGRSQKNQDVLQLLRFHRYDTLSPKSEYLPVMVSL